MVVQVPRHSNDCCAVESNVVAWSGRCGPPRTKRCYAGVSPRFAVPAGRLPGTLPGRRRAPIPHARVSLSLWRLGEWREACEAEPVN